MKGKHKIFNRAVKNQFFVFFKSTLNHRRLSLTIDSANLTFRKCLILSSYFIDTKLSDKNGKIFYKNCW